MAPIIMVLVSQLLPTRLSDAAKEQITYKNIMKLMGVQSLPKMENIDLKLPYENPSGISLKPEAGLKVLM